MCECFGKLCRDECKHDTLLCVVGATLRSLIAQYCTSRTNFGVDHYTESGVVVMAVTITRSLWRPEFEFTRKYVAPGRGEAALRSDVSLLRLQAHASTQIHVRERVLIMRLCCHGLVSHAADGAADGDAASGTDIFGVVARRRWSCGAAAPQNPHTDHRRRHARIDM